MALINVHPSGLNFFDCFLTEFQRMEAEMARMRQEMCQLLPEGPMAAVDQEVHRCVPIVDEGGERKMKLSFNVKDFGPQEVQVKVLGNNTLQVRAQHEERSEQGDSVQRRVYVRQYLLPKGIDMEHIRPSLSKDGVLTVEAPAPSLAPTERLVPVEYKGD